MSETDLIAHLLLADGSWVEARVEKTADGTLLHPLSGGEEPVMSASPLLLRNSLDGDGAEDMTTLSHLHEPALLHNLQHRLARHHVYTDVGQICIAVSGLDLAAHPCTTLFR